MISQSIVRKRNVVFNNITNDWYTPPFVIESVKNVLGTIDLDPASCDEAQQWIQAKKYYTKETNGYDKTWLGKVFLNPPYGQVHKVKTRGSAAIWLEKLIQEYIVGNVTEAIAVCNTSPHNKWYAMVYDYPIVVTSGPLKFIKGNPNSNATHNIYSTTFMYLGLNISAFVQEFSKYGIPLQKINAR